MDFSEVFEFYENELSKRFGNCKYVRCKDTRDILKSIFPNVKYAFVPKRTSDNVKINVVTKTKDMFGLDVSGTNVIIITNEGKCLNLGSSEWGHLIIQDTSKFIVEV